MLPAMAWPRSDQRVHGAFVLGAPGTYVEEAPGALVVGNRPGAYHKVLAAVMLAIGLASAWLVWPEVPALAALMLLLFGGVPLLAMLNTQRWEVRPGMLALRGRALGRAVERDLPLGPDTAVRVGTRVEYDQDGSSPRWTVFQAQVRAGGVWVGVAESQSEAAARSFAQRVAAAARVPIAP